MVAAPIFLSLGYKPFQAVLLSFYRLTKLVHGGDGNWYDYRFAAYQYASYNTWYKYSAIKYRYLLISSFFLYMLLVAGRLLLKSGRKDSVSFYYFLSESIFLTHT